MSGFMRRRPRGGELEHSTWDPVCPASVVERLFSVWCHEITSSSVTALPAPAPPRPFAKRTRRRVSSSLPRSRTPSTTV